MIDWSAVQTWSFTNGAVQEKKAAEFLIESSMPFDLVEFIGVHSLQVRDRVRAIIQGASYTPRVEVAPHWYY